jgi:uncharacterized protein YdhG (YjbR/CyaY superfamily)
METVGAGLKSVDKYIASFPPRTRRILKKLRKAIGEAAPKAKETMAYGIPTFRQNGYLVHFAAFRGHIGFYPTPSGIRAFRKELSGYGTSRGAVRFTIDKPIPYGIVKRIVRFRAREDEGRKRQVRPAFRTPKNHTNLKPPGQ